MITDINKFNELECKQRNEKIAATHDYNEFKANMQKRLQDQQAAAKKAETHFLPPPVITLPGQPSAMNSLDQLAIEICKSSTPAKITDKSMDLKRKSNVPISKLA